MRHPVYFGVMKPLGRVRRVVAMAVYAEPPATNNTHIARDIVSVLRSRASNPKRNAQHHYGSAVAHCGP